MPGTVRNVFICSMVALTLSGCCMPFGEQSYVFEFVIENDCLEPITVVFTDERHNNTDVEVSPGKRYEKGFGTRWYGNCETLEYALKEFKRDAQDMRFTIIRSDKSSEVFTIDEFMKNADHEFSIWTMKACGRSGTSQ